MKAFVFPGQGAQFSGMGKELYESSPAARNLFDKADEILGFEISKIMFEGSDEELRHNPQCSSTRWLPLWLSVRSSGPIWWPDTRSAS